MSQAVRVFVPVPEGLFVAVAPPRAGIAGGAIEASAGNVCVDYEAAELQPANINTYADRVLHAAERHVTRDPTSKRLWVEASDLIDIGYWDQEAGRVQLDNSEVERDLADWLGVRELDETELLATSHRYEIERQMDAMAVSADPRQRFFARWLGSRRRR